MTRVTLFPNKYKKCTSIIQSIHVCTSKRSPLQVITIDGAVVTKADQDASNGVLHVVNKVLLPPVGNVVESVSKCPKFKTLTAAVINASLATALSGK